MTVRQIIQEIEALPAKEQREVLVHLTEKEAANPAIRYLDHEAARPMIKEILAEHAELFSKLSK
jgi:hypothetical protein